MADDSVVKQLTVRNKMGLHARPAAMIVQTANKFPCDVHLEKDGQNVNGKSIMGVLMLVASKGSTVLVRARGERAADAVAAIVKLIDDKFGEAK